MSFKTSLLDLNSRSLSNGEFEFELKESPWQLSTFANVNKFVVFAPNEMHNLPLKVRSEIVRVFGTRSGFSIILDRSASMEMARIKLKTAVFIPFDVELFEREPLKAESMIKGCFDTPNPYLSPSIRLKHGFTKYNPNPSVAFVGSNAYLQRQIDVEDSMKLTTSLHLVILPLSTPIKDIVSFVSSATHFDGKHSFPMEVGANLGQYLEEGGTRKKSSACVLVCVTMHSRPASNKASSVEVETFLMVNLPSGKRLLGETTSAAASRVFLEQTGIMRTFTEASCTYSFLTSDKVNKIFVQEVADASTGFLPSLTTGFLPSLSTKLMGSSSLPCSPTAAAPLMSPTKGGRKIFSAASTPRKSFSAIGTPRNGFSPNDVSTRFSEDFEALVRLSDTSSISPLLREGSGKQVDPYQEYGTRVVTW